MEQDVTPYTPQYTEIGPRVIIQETDQIATTEFDSVNFILCNGVVGQIVTGLFYIGECDS